LKGFKDSKKEKGMVDTANCIFCKMVRGEIPTKKIFEDDRTLAFLDINPRNPGHTLVIPKGHVETLMDLPDQQDEAYLRAVKRVAKQVKAGVRAQGISIIQNNGQAAGQVVAHLHFHIIPRFSNEGPLALEAILQPKKLDEKSMQQIAETIRKGSPVLKPSEPVKPPPREEPEPQEEPPEEEEPKKKDKHREDDDLDDVDEFEEIDTSEFEKF